MPFAHTASVPDGITVVVVVVVGCGTMTVSRGAGVLLKLKQPPSANGSSRTTLETRIESPLDQMASINVRHESWFQKSAYRGETVQRIASVGATLNRRSCWIGVAWMSWMPPSCET